MRPMHSVRIGIWTGLRYIELLDWRLTYAWLLLERNNVFNTYYTVDHSELKIGYFDASLFLAHTHLTWICSHFLRRLWGIIFQTFFVAKILFQTIDKKITPELIKRNNFYIFTFLKQFSYSEQQIPKFSAQLDKTFSKCIFCLYFTTN